MNMPEFTAETSLYRSSRHYRQQATVYSESFGRDILPALPILGSLEPHIGSIPCPPLHVELPYPSQTCYTEEGVRGTRYCTQTCHFYYRRVFQLFGGAIKCVQSSIICDDPECGDCQPGITPPIF